MSLGSIVSDAANAALGRSSSTGIKDFLAKFSDSSGKFVNTINPLNTFEVSFKFYPTLDVEAEDKSWLQSLGDSLASSAIGAAKNLVNNVTGGLLGSLLNDKDGVVKARKEFGSGDFYSESGTSFMHYLAAANLLVGDENTWFGSAGQAAAPLEMQLGYYTQSITIPMLKIPDGGKSTTMAGDVPVNGTVVIPDNNQIQLKIINTKLPLCERIFYPWMREVTLPWWQYYKQPYTTATVTVDFSQHTDLQYVFTNCRPCQIQTIQANQQNDQSTTRDVTLMFDFMFVTSKLTTMESLTDKLLGAGATVFNAAAGMVNF